MLTGLEIKQFTISNFQLSWALEEMSVRPTYLSNQLEEDVEEFAVRAVKFAENQSPTVMEKIKSAMATVSSPC